MRLVFALGLAALTLATARNKRVVDEDESSPRRRGLFRFRGGAKDTNCEEVREKIGLTDCPSRPRRGGLLAHGPKRAMQLLEVEKETSTDIVLPEKYHFMEEVGKLNPRYKRCAPVQETVRDQELCNNCWAFSTSRAMDLGLCRALARVNFEGSTRETYYMSAISPFRIVCGVYGTETPDMCRPEALSSSFEWVLENGLKPSLMFWNTHTKGNEVNIGNVTAASCAAAETYDEHVRLPTITFRTASIFVGSTSWKRFIMGQGPIIPIMRVCEEFAEFTGSFFKGPCNRFLDTSTGEIVDGSAPVPEENWSNHFVVVHGWGVEDGESYWLVENSWGLIYDPGNLFSRDHYGLTSMFNYNGTKSALVKIARSVEGEGALEMINRYAMIPRDISHRLPNGQVKAVANMTGPEVDYMFSMGVEDSARSARD